LQLTFCFIEGQASEQAVAEFSVSDFSQGLLAFVQVLHGGSWLSCPRHAALDSSAKRVVAKTGCQRGTGASSATTLQ
jgi:hypothetical protein